MGDTIGKVLDWVKSPRQSAIVFVASLALLFLPPHLRETLGLQAFERYRGWVALAAAVSGAALLVESINHGFSYLKTKSREKGIRKRGEEYLRTLSAEERGIMVLYCGSPSDTQYLHSTDGNVGSLLRKRLIYSGSRLGHLTDRGPRGAYNIQPWAREYINSHPEILDGAQQPAPPPTPYGRRSWME
jgi:Super-infection exclusion protein B